MHTYVWVSGGKKCWSPAGITAKYHPKRFSWIWNLTLYFRPFPKQLRWLDCLAVSSEDFEPTLAYLYILYHTYLRVRLGSFFFSWISICTQKHQHNPMTTNEDMIVKSIAQHDWLRIVKHMEVTLGYFQLD